MTKFFLLFFISMQILLSSSYYIKPIVTNPLVKTCRCGLIVPEAKCDSIFHNPEMPCGLMTVVYGVASYPECSRVYITCTKQGFQWQSVGIVGKVANQFTNLTEWSLLSNRKLTFNHQVLTCGPDGVWISQDLEGNPFIHPLQIQCASSDASDAFEYYVTDSLI